jgi:hypothetical protein
VVNIEKLSNKIPRNRLPYLTVTDLLLGKCKTNNNRIGYDFNNEILGPIIINKLNDISFGTKFGVDGIAQKDLWFLDSQTVIETTFENLLSWSREDQIYIIKNFRILLTDLEEGGGQFGFFNKCLISYLESLGILPRQIIVLSGGYLLKDHPELNVYHARIENYFYHVIFGSDYFIDLLASSDMKDSAVEKIRNKNKKLALALIRKPRLNRVRFLAELHSRNILEKIDWSLFYITGKTEYAGRLFNLSGNPMMLSAIDKSDSKILELLSAYEFPRVFSNLGMNHHMEAIIPDQSWVGNYYYYISGEAYDSSNDSDHVKAVNYKIGPLGFITEKTYKAFAIGSYPLILGTKKIEAEVKKLGFELLDTPYDELDGTDRITAMVDFIENIESLEWPEEMVINNFLKVTDVGFLSDMISNQLNHITTLIKN